MSQLQAYIDPTSTSQLLNDLSKAIDETRLVTAINCIQDDIYKIESASGPSRRTQYLRKEVVILESRLTDIRNQATLC